MFGGLARADQNRGRRREPEGAGTRDDEHGDERDRREHAGGRRPHVEPDDERGDRQRHHDRHEHARHPIGELLDRGLGRLGVFDQLNDLAQRGVLAHARRAERDATRGIQRRPDHLVADLSRHRHRLSGQHGFVHCRRTFGDDTVHGDLFARLHDHQIAPRDRLDRDLGFPALPQHVRRPYAQTGEPADRFGGTALGARLQQSPEEDQRDDRGHGFVVDIGCAPRGREHAGSERRRERKQVGGTSADRDEGVHVGRAMREPTPRPLVELAAGPDDHGQGEDRQGDPRPARVEHCAAGQRFVQPSGQRGEQPPQQVHLPKRRVGVVGQQQHRAQHGDQRHDDREAEFPGERANLTRSHEPFALERILGRDWLGDLEPGSFDGALQRFGGRRARDVVDRGGLGRLIGDGADHAGHGAQRVLERCHTGCVVQLLDCEHHARLAAVVAGGANRVDQLGNVRLRVVVIHRGLGGGIIDRRVDDAGGPPEGPLHGRGARRAAHPLDGQDDAGLTHGACAARLRGAARRWPAPPPGGPSACSCRSGSGTRPPARG